jgi:hypothetical protein
MQVSLRSSDFPPMADRLDLIRVGFFQIVCGVCCRAASSLTARDGVWGGYICQQCWRADADADFDWTTWVSGGGGS